MLEVVFFFFQAEDGIRDIGVTGVQTCALPISQALHVTLMGNNGQWIEVQIRSERMNDVAEQGFAAHWKYKEGGGSEDEGELEKWLKTVKEILDDPQPDAIDFLDTIKLNLFASEIFVFTPKGELKTMPDRKSVV